MKRPAPVKMMGLFLLALGAVSLLVDSSSAQCSTCPTPVVAYQPVTYQPSVVYTPYKGWYPGKLLDQWRMRRYGYSEPVAVTASYAPYTASYVPYTASYAPTTYSASYVPYTANYVPASTSYVTTNYAPTSYVTAYAPLGQRQVLMRPVVVSSPVVSTGCTTCAYTEACDPCSGCSACSSGVTAATYGAPACPSCATGSASTYGSTTGGLEAPSMTPEEAAPFETRYRSEEERPSEEERSKETPGPATETNSYYDFDAPALVIPDRTARRNVGKPIQRGASVDVRNAVYVKPAEMHSTSVQQASAAARDAADGWSSIPASR